MMTKKLFDRERKSVKKLANMQIPHSYKKVGIAVAIMGLLMLVLNRFQFDNETFRHIARHTMLVGFLLISLSKAKIEDEFIKQIRMQSYSFAFIFCVAYSILMPYLDAFIDYIRGIEVGLKDTGDFMILWMFLSIQVFYFEYVKKLFK